MQSKSRPQETPEPRASVSVDAERPVEDIDDGLDVPLEAPIETPVGDLIEQRRSVPLEDPDEH